MKKKEVKHTIKKIANEKRKEKKTANKKKKK